MKAFSLKLVKGEIDQENQCVIVNWVQPRSLDKIQLKAMRDSLQGWSDKIKHLISEFKANGSEVFVQ